MKGGSELYRLVSRLVTITDSGCWIYGGWDNGNGYKKIRFRGECTYVHRAAYEIFHRKKLRADIELDHECCNRSCANPAHLVPMKHKRNSQLRSRRKRVREST